jgi:hypothetical protein
LGIDSPITSCDTRCLSASDLFVSSATNWSGLPEVGKNQKMMESESPAEGMMEEKDNFVFVSLNWAESDKKSAFKRKKRGFSVFER